MTEEAKAPEGWTTSEINFEVRVHVDGPIYVVKTKGKRGSEGYLRIMAGRLMGTSSRRMATRFDSATWAKTFAVQIAKEAKPRVVRLWTKAERELARQQQQTWTAKVWMKTEKKVEEDSAKVPLDEGPKE